MDKARDALAKKRAKIKAAQQQRLLGKVKSIITDYRNCSNLKIHSLEIKFEQIKSQIDLALYSVGLKEDMTEVFEKNPTVDDVKVILQQSQNGSPNSKTVVVKNEVFEELLPKLDDHQLCEPKQQKEQIAELVSQIEKLKVEINLLNQEAISNKQKLRYFRMKLYNYKRRCKCQHSSLDNVREKICH